MMPFNTHVDTVLRARDIGVKLTSRRLGVALKGRAAQGLVGGSGGVGGSSDEADGLLAEGALAHPIDTDGSSWWIEEGRVDSDAGAEGDGARGGGAPLTNSHARVRRKVLQKKQNC